MLVWVQKYLMKSETSSCGLVYRFFVTPHNVRHARGDIVLTSDPDSFKAHAGARVVLALEHDTIDDLVRTTVANDILIVGRSTTKPVPARLEGFFGAVCYVNCRSKKHRGAPGKYRCCASDLESVRTRILDTHHRGDVLVVSPHHYRNGKQMAIDKNRAKYKGRHVDPDTQHSRLPALKKQSMGWLSTGMAVMQHFLFDETTFDHVYMYGFSHWKADGSVVAPPKGMKDAFTGEVGNHVSEYERLAAEDGSNTGKVFFIDTSHVF